MSNEEDKENLDKDVSLEPESDIMTDSVVETIDKIPPLTTETVSMEHRQSASIDSFLISPHEGVGVPWREALLLKLKDSSALPIVKEIKRILKFLAKPEHGINEKADITQRFYEDCRSMMVASPAWKEASDEEVNSCLDSIERYVFVKSHEYVYQPAECEDAVRDRLFVEKAEELSELPLTALCSITDLTSMDVLQGVVGETIEAFQEMQLACTPNEKLESIYKAVKGVAECKRDGGTVSADMLIPFLVWVMVKNPPTKLISDIRYIQRFRNQTRLTGEVSYCLTNIIAVITLVEKMHAEKVSKTDPIYSLIAAEDQERSIVATSTVNTTTTTSTMTEINNVANSVMNTIGFVPRAIGSAVADTFRSRSTRTIVPTPNIVPPLVIPPPTTPGIKELREKVKKIPTDNLNELSIKEILIALQDYKEIILKYT